MPKSDVDILRGRAEAANRDGRPAEAAAAWTAVGERLAVRHQDAAAEAWREAVRAFGRAGDHVAAHAAAGRAVDLAGRSRWAHSRVDALRMRAGTWEALGRRMDAVTDLEAAVAATAGRYQDPVRAAARAELGQAWIRVGLVDDGVAEVEAGLKVAARKKWMAGLVAGWQAELATLRAAAAWAKADGGRAVGFWSSERAWTVFVDGEPTDGVGAAWSGPIQTALGAADVAHLRLGGELVAVVHPRAPGGVARLVTAAVDPASETTEGRRDPATAPTVV